jgi:hypothetical protein
VVAVGGLLVGGCSVVPASAPSVLVVAAEATTPGAPISTAAIVSEPEPPTTLAPTTVASTTTLPPTTLPPTTTLPPPAPCHIAYLADSVGTDLLLNGLAEALGGVGCTIAWSRARRGSPLFEGVQALTAATAETTATDTVLVLQGYSKARANRARFPAMLEGIMQAAGARTVVWPLYGPTSDCSAGYTETLAEANRLLVEAATRWPNLRLADYPAVIGAHPEYSQDRCPHLRGSGSTAVSQWLAAQVRLLVDRR